MLDHHGIVVQFPAGEGCLYHPAFYSFGKRLFSYCPPSTDSAMNDWSHNPTLTMLSQPVHRLLSFTMFPLVLLNIYKLEKDGEDQLDRSCEK